MCNKAEAVPNNQAGRAVAGAAEINRAAGLSALLAPSPTGAEVVRQWRCRLQI
jgi:hypothetical protein